MKTFVAFLCARCIELYKDAGYLYKSLHNSKQGKCDYCKQQRYVEEYKLAKRDKT